MYLLFKYTDPFLEYLCTYTDNGTIGHFIVNTFWLLILLAGFLVIYFSGHLTLINHGIGFMEMTYFFICAIKALDLNIENSCREFLQILQTGGLLYTEGIVLGPIFLYLFKIRNKK